MPAGRVERYFIYTTTRCLSQEEVEERNIVDGLEMESREVARWAGGLSIPRRLVSRRRTEVVDGVKDKASEVREENR